MAATRSQQIVRDLVLEYESLQTQEEVNSFVNTLHNNEEMQRAFYQVLDKDDLLRPMTQMILDLYRRKETPERKALFIQYIPCFVAVYFMKIGRQEKKNFRFLETMFLVMYSIEYNHRQRLAPVRVPSLIQGSIYHDGAKVDASDVERIERRGGHVIHHENIWVQNDTMNSQNRPRVLSHLLNVYNTHLGSYSKYALEAFCTNILRLFNMNKPRVILPQPILIELLFASFFCIHNGFQQQGSNIVDFIHRRGLAMTNSSVLLTVAAVNHLLRKSGPSQNSIAPVSSQLTKNMITNASFRAKKIGDDIDVVSEQEGSTAPSNSNAMPNIPEDDEGEQRGQKIDGEAKSNKKLDKIIHKVKGASKKSGGGEVAKKGGGGEGQGKGGKLERKKKPHPKEGDGKIESLDQVEELIKTQNLPTETITIHSPESGGTTLF